MTPTTAGPYFSWTLSKHLARKHIGNAHELAVGARLSYPVAQRIFDNEPAGRVDAATLLALKEFFGVKNALTLIQLVDRD